MAIVAADLKVLLSANLNGGAITSTAMAGNNLFGVFTGDETAAGRTEYACVYVQNDSAQTAFAAEVFVDSETAHTGSNYSIGLGASAINAVEPTTTDEITPPAGVTFSEADGAANSLVIGDLAAGAHKAVWIRLAVAAGTAARDNVALQLSVRVDTGA